MFLKFNIHQKNGIKLNLTKQTNISMQNSDYRDYILSALSECEIVSPTDNSSIISQINFSLGFPKKIRSMICRHTSFLPNDESYAIVLGEVTEICSTTERGFIYAASTLLQLVEFGELVLRQSRLTCKLLNFLVKFEVVITGCGTEHACTTYQQG